MKKDELRQAMDIARSDRDLSSIDITPLAGYALRDFQRVTVAVEAVARMIRWQCFTLDGGIDGEALNELADCFCRKVTVI
jgi:hypothetical protein